MVSRSRRDSLAQVRMRRCPPSRNPAVTFICCHNDPDDRYRPDPDGRSSRKQPLIGCRVELPPTGKRHLCTAHTPTLNACAFNFPRL